MIIRSGRTLWDSDLLVAKNGGKPTMSITQVQNAGPKVGPIARLIPALKSIPDPGETHLLFEQEQSLASTRNRVIMMINPTKDLQVQMETFLCQL